MVSKPEMEFRESSKQKRDQKLTSEPWSKVSSQDQQRVEGNLSSLPKSKGALKVVFLGGSDVGKTSIITRLVSNSFEDKLESTTEAVEITKSVDFENENKPVTLKIWDTPSKEVYEAIKKDIYENAQVIVLVYDLTNQESFDELENYWVVEAKKHSNEKTSKLFLLFY